MNAKSATLFTHWPPKTRKPIVLVAAALTFAVSSEGTERVWDGGSRSSGNWTDAGNWTVQGGAPVPGDDLRFPAVTLRLANTNDFPAGTSFHQLTYAGAGFTASGNEIDLSGGLLVSHSGGSTVLNFPVNVTASQTFMVSGAGATLFLNGPVDLGRNRSLLIFDGAGQTIVSADISGSGPIIGGDAIRKNGAGQLFILSHLTLSGATTVNGGTLRMDGSLSNSAVTLNAGATLLGNGKLGGLTANAGSTVSPGETTPDTLDSLGDVTLATGSTLNIRLNGTNAGLNYDQLRVQGTVTLGGTLNVTAAFTPAVGDRFTLIDNDGTDEVVGTFAGLPEGAVLMLNGRPFKISYGNRFGGPFGRDVNDVTLEAVPALAVWDGGGGLNNNWSQPVNWTGDVLPMPGDDVQFANSSSDTLVTVNDFPAGMVFGSLIFGQGSHRLEGSNLAVFNGPIQITESNRVEIFMPVTLAVGFRLGEPSSLALNGSVALAANQVFHVDHSNATLRIGGSLNLGAHNLVLRAIPRLYLGSFVPSIIISGDLGGDGMVIKEGAGILSLDAAKGRILGPAPVMINEGKFSVSGPYFGQQIFGPLIINTGAVLSVDGAGLGDLEVRGGTYLGSARFYGDVRLLEGSTFSAAVVEHEPGSVFVTGMAVGKSLELAGCTLDLQVLSDVQITNGTRLVMVDVYSAEPIIGTFDGLPEGTRFLADGHAFTITYQGGDHSNRVVLTVNAPFIWDGGGSGNLWGTASNWVGDVAPIPGSDLVFPDGVSKLGMINAFDPGSSFRSLTFTSPSYLLVGNSFGLTEGIYNDAVSGDTTITADITPVPFSGEITCRVSNASRLSLEGGVTANASWRKTGTGTLRLAGTGPNSLANMLVWEGELELDKTPGVNAISSGFGALSIGDGTNEARVILLGDEQIADDNLVILRGPARLDLNGHDESIGSLQGDGTVVLNSRLIPGDLNRSSRLTVTQGTFAGTITGQGGLTKTGVSSAALWLTGHNTYSGPTILNGGTLVVDGVQTNSPIRLDGGLLRGRGRVGTLTGNLGGTVQPGDTALVFENRFFCRDVAFNSTTTFRPLLTSQDPGFENSQLQVTGTVDLGGSTLSVELFQNFKPTNGFSFLIIDNDGTDPVVGTFAGLPEGALFGGGGLPFRISYAGGTGNDVVITRVVAPAPMLSSLNALSNGQMSIAGLGIGGVIYTIQAATNLNPIIFWTKVGDATANVNGLFQFTHTGASNQPRRFYRAVAP